ncbi:hypothetical protein KCU91_g4718, partial [Aureobasidium melanogenum]
MDFPFPERPGPDTYIEAERDFVQPAPMNEPPGPKRKRMDHADSRFGPDERIFDRMTYDDNKVYWSRDTQTPLTREATCASAGLHNNSRVFVSTRGHSDSLDKTA